MYTSYIMETIARQRMDENARKARAAVARSTPRRTPRAFHVPRAAWHRQSVRTA